LVENRYKEIPKLEDYLHKRHIDELAFYVALCTLILILLHCLLGLVLLTFSVQIPRDMWAYG